MKYGSILINVAAFCLNLLIAYFNYEVGNRHRTIFFACCSGFSFCLVVILVALLLGWEITI